LDTEELAKGYGTKGIWTAFSPDNRLILCYNIGDRTLNDCRAYFKNMFLSTINLYMNMCFYKTIILWQEIMFSIHKILDIGDYYPKIILLEKLLLSGGQKIQTITNGSGKGFLK
jgi:hypothetical protein